MTSKNWNKRNLLWFFN